MATNPNALLKEFEEVRREYMALLAKLIDQKVPGVIDPVAAKCNVGEVCHGGEFLQFRDVLTPEKGPR